VGFSLRFFLFHLIVNILCQPQPYFYSVIWNLSTIKLHFSLSTINLSKNKLGYGIRMQPKSDIDWS